MNFSEKARLVHGNKYDYSLVNYKNAKSKVIIICPRHGEFCQTPNSHLSGSGCRRCFIERNTNRLRSNTEEFIKKAKLIHGNKYDYSLVNYKEAKSKVIIICPKHGEFKQSPHSHLKGYGCNNCIKYNLEEFIKKSKLVHGDKYDYSLVDYKNCRSKIVLICRKHGKFIQVAQEHLKGSGCRKCYIEKTRKTNNEFIKKAKSIHGNKYDYSLSNYISNKSKVIITCPKHGKFNQRPDKHLFAREGCPLCPAVISKPHQDIVDYIKSICNSIINVNDRNTIFPKELDIFLPYFNVAIELHGLYYHSFSDFSIEKQQKMNLYKKHDICLAKNIKLFQIFENEWIFKNDIVKSIINCFLGLLTKIYARKCEIFSLTNDCFNNFCNNNHLKGAFPSNIKIGLRYDGDVVCVAGFNKHHLYDWEITRFCSRNNILVVGGFSKILKYFVSFYSPVSVFSYADRRISFGNVYNKNGFELLGITGPNYFYCKKYDIYSRQQFQKNKLSKKLQIYDEKLSEVENMFINGYRRIWDAGHYKYLKRFNK